MDADAHRSVGIGSFVSTVGRGFEGLGHVVFVLGGDLPALQTPTDYVEFTPTKKGTFGFACSMGMGTGTLIVE